jgi:hypothetical protein
LVPVALLYSEIVGSCLYLVTSDDREERGTVLGAEGVLLLGTMGFLAVCWHPTIHKRDVITIRTTSVRVINFFFCKIISLLYGFWLVLTGTGFVITGKLRYNF